MCKHQPPALQQKPSTARPLGQRRIAPNRGTLLCNGVLILKTLASCCRTARSSRRTGSNMSRAGATT